MRNLLGNRAVRVVAASCAIVVGLSAAGWAIGAALDGSTAGGAKTRTSAQSVLAKNLARGVVKARTPTQRYKALLRVMKALRVGVYRTNGKPVVHGAERTWDDLYVYDVELRPMMTDALAHRDTQSLTQATVPLAAIATRLKLRSVTPQRVASALRRQILWVRKHPTRKGDLGALLIAELGKQRFHYDLSKSTALSKIKFDALQSWLLRADVAASLIHYMRAHPKKSKGRAVPATSRAHRAFDPCSYLKSGARREAYETGQTAKDVYGWSKDIASGDIPGVPEPKDLAVGYGHFAWLNEGLNSYYEVDPDQGITHYAPAGVTHGETHGDPDRTTRYRIKVEMTLNTSKLLAKCGFLAGVDLPEKGNVEGVPVNWSVEPRTADQDILKHATPVQPLGTPTPSGVGGAGGGPLATVTDSSGKAGWDFRPNREFLAGVGTEKAAFGTLVATVEVYEHFGAPTVLSLLTKVFSDQNKRFVHRMPYVIYRHAPKGYKISQAGPWTDNYGAGWDRIDKLEGQVCNENPFAAPWTFTATGISHPGYGGEFVINQTRPVTFPTVGVPLVTRSFRNGIIWNLQLTILDATATSPARMVIEPVNRRTGSKQEATITEAEC